MMGQEPRVGKMWQFAHAPIIGCCYRCCPRPPSTFLSASDWPGDYRAGSPSRATPWKPARILLGLAGTARCAGLANEPFHCSDYLLDRPFRVNHLVRPQSYCLGLAFQASSFDERQCRHPIQLLEQFGRVAIWQIKVDYNANGHLVGVFQDTLCLGERPCMNATQARMPFEQEC
jgi:hypothetical protein